MMCPACSIRDLVKNGEALVVLALEVRVHRDLRVPGFLSEPLEGRGEIAVR
jgi:hypothetical protein